MQRILTAALIVALAMVPVLGWIVLILWWWRRRHSPQRNAAFRARMGYGSTHPTTSTKSSSSPSTHAATQAATHDLILVKLSPDQIAAAKEANGRRRRITHALLCGPYGQRFDTERQCRRYFEAWDPGSRNVPGIISKSRRDGPPPHHRLSNYMGLGRNADPAYTRPTLRSRRHPPRRSPMSVRTTAARNPRDAVVVHTSSVQPHTVSRTFGAGTFIGVWSGCLSLLWGRSSGSPNPSASARLRASSTPRHHRASLGCRDTLRFSLPSTRCQNPASVRSRAPWLEFGCFRRACGGRGANEREAIRAGTSCVRPPIGGMMAAPSATGSEGRAAQSFRAGTELS